MSGTSFRRDYGGPAVSVSHLAAALADIGARVGLWAPDGSAETSDVVPTARGAFVRLAGSLEEALDAFGRPDVMHDNGLWLPHHHRIARLADKRRIARVVSVRGMLEPWAIRHKRLKKAMAWRLYQKRDLEKATVIHATATSEAKAIEAMGLTTQAVVIPNGTDLPRAWQKPIRAGVSGTPRQALFLSRIHEKKGLPLLIEAWAGLRPAGWHLAIAGPDEGGHRAEVESLVDRHGLSAVVSFPGLLDGEAKSNAYRAADLFILPTYSENFGLVVAEALSYGVPVLTTNATPWRELVTERCGWQVDATIGGVHSGLAMAIASPPDTLIEMGRRGRDLIASRYAWAPIARTFLATYAQIMTSAPAPAVGS